MLAYAMTGYYSAISYAVMKPGECKFEGIGVDKDILPGFKDNDSWEQLMQKWEEAVERISNDFLTGVADVDPLNPNNGKSACKYCGLDIFCRVAELEYAGTSGKVKA